LETLRVIEAIVPPDIQLQIPFAKARIHQDGVINDAQTMADVNVALNELYSMVSEGYAKNNNPNL